MGGGGGGGRATARGLGPGSGRGGRSGPASAPARAAAGATCAGCSALLRPYRAARRGDARRAGARDRRLARAAAAREARDRRGHRSATTPTTLVLVVRRVPRLGAARVVHDLRADLPRRLGRPARARGPAHPHLHPPAAPADRLLREPPGGRLDLAHDQRRRGAGKPRHGLGRDALPVGPDADRRDRRAALPRPQARAVDVLHRAVRRRRSASGSGSSRPAPSGARARRSARSPATCRRRCRASASCAASARSRSTRRGSPSSTRTTARRT